MRISYLKSERECPRLRAWKAPWPPGRSMYGTHRRNTQEGWCDKQRAWASWQRRPGCFEGQVGLKEGEGRGLAEAVGAKEAVRRQIRERWEQFADELEMMAMDDDIVSGG